MSNEPKLVVLFSTQYRTWNKTQENHINLIRHICDSEENCIVGIHYWDTNIGNGYSDSEPSETNLPIMIQKLKHKSSHTPNLSKYIFCSQIESIIHSTKIALENAKSLYRELYSKEMPDEQLILRIRPDVLITDINNFPKNIPNDNSFVNLWNTLHRCYNPVAPEAGDTVVLTTKQVIEKICNIDINNIDDIITRYKSKGFVANFSEQYLYGLLYELNISCVHNHSLKIAIQRQNNIESLTH